jgi:hypothetical protein
MATGMPGDGSREQQRAANCCSLLIKSPRPHTRADKGSFGDVLKAACHQRAVWPDLWLTRASGGCLLAVLG